MNEERRFGFRHKVYVSLPRLVCRPCFRDRCDFILDSSCRIDFAEPLLVKFQEIVREDNVSVRLSSRRIFGDALMTRSGSSGRKSPLRRRPNSLVWISGGRITYDTRFLCTCPYTRPPLPPPPSRSHSPLPLLFLGGRRARRTPSLYQFFSHCSQEDS